MGKHPYAVKYKLDEPCKMENILGHGITEAIMCGTQVLVRPIYKMDVQN
jgi:hypothetical protein